MSPGENKQSAHHSQQLEAFDIELQKQPPWPAAPAGDHDDDDAPLLGEPQDDAGAGDMATMPMAAWLLLAAAVRRRLAACTSDDGCLCCYGACTCFLKQFRLTVYVLLQSQLCAKSSAGAVFEALHDVGPFTAAAWRMQVATLGMLPFAVFQYWRCGSGVQAHPVRRLHRACCHDPTYQPCKPSCLSGLGVGSETCLRRWQTEGAQLWRPAACVRHPSRAAVGVLRLGDPAHEPIAHAAVPVSDARAVGSIHLAPAAANLCRRSSRACPRLRAV